MAKVTIEFDSIEDQHELDMCINGGKWYTLAWDLDQYLRNRLKYDPMSDKEYEVLQQTRDKLHELRSENGLTFD
jgi:N6-adenosine-specific RNA methylase IME4